MWLLVRILVLHVLLVQSADDFLYGTFPDGFKWSTATSAYQIEGAWNETGKGENIWDRFCHVGGNVLNNETGDVACDSYHKHPEDIQLMKNLGVSMYRFSISWARIFANGTKDSYNQEGVNYYNGLIDALIAAGIQPMVTLYHWDLPQPLMDIGGWVNESLIEYFVDYADTCFQKFGDRVKLWLTFNEPFVVTWVGYGTGAHAPGIKRPGDAPYRAAHTILKSHAEAWHLYNDTYRPIQNGKISITLDCDWKEPRTANQKDKDAAERALLFKLGWYAHPIFKTGDYPEVMKQRVAEKSGLQNLTKSRLPEFTEREKKRLLGTHDFFGFNHYTTQMISHKDEPLNPPSYWRDQDIDEYSDPSWPDSGTGWLKSVPWGFRKLLKYIKDTYGNPVIYITENGVSDKCQCLDDTDRIEYYTAYINQMLKAVKLDHVDVVGYTAWSLLDNFEWNSGYSQRFGLHYVNFTDPNRTRTPKKSVDFYKKLIKDNGFPQPPTGGASLPPAPWRFYSFMLAGVAVWYLIKA